MPQNHVCGRSLQLLCFRIFMQGCIIHFSSSYAKPTFNHLISSSSIINFSVQHSFRALTCPESDRSIRRLESWSFCVAFPLRAIRAFTICGRTLLACKSSANFTCRQHSQVICGMWTSLVSSWDLTSYLLQLCRECHAKGSCSVNIPNEWLRHVLAVAQWDMPMGKDWTSIWKERFLKSRHWNMSAAHRQPTSCEPWKGMPSGLYNKDRTYAWSSEGFCWWRIAVFTVQQLLWWQRRLLPY